MNKLKFFETVIKNNRFRSQVILTVAEKFPKKSLGYKKITKSIDDVVKTHNKGRRRNGQYKKTHEFGILGSGIHYCPEENFNFFVALAKHDMHEDYKLIWPISRIIEEDGEEVAAIVLSVTEPERLASESDEDYNKRKYNKVETEGIRSIKAKILDRCHNMHTLNLSGSNRKQLHYIEETKKYILPWAKEHNFMYEELQGLIVKNEKRLDRYKRHHS